MRKGYSRMNKKYLRWLYSELPGMVDKGVISPAASDDIRAYYGEVKTPDRRWFSVILCAAAGTLMIGLGIISLFGHNWEELSRPFRAGLLMALLFAAQSVCFWVLLKRPDSHAFGEGAGVFLSLAVGAAMALIGQTYNIPGDTGEFMFSWMMLILPVVYFMEATIPAAIYVAGVTAWTGGSWDDPFKAFLFWPLLLLAVPHLIWAMRRAEYTVRAAILALVMALCVFIGTGFTLGRTWYGSGIVVYPALITLVYLIGTREFGGSTALWQKPFRFFGGIGVFIAMFVLSFREPWESLTGKYANELPGAFTFQAVPDHILTASFIGMALFFFFESVRRRETMRAFFGALSITAVLGYILGILAASLAMVLFNLFLLCVSVGRIVVGMKSFDLRVINTGMFMLAALILARFFDSQIGMAVKGIAFIIIGIGFLAANLVIIRRKGSLLCEKN
ncbi:MAG: DUF2157 domain-containing protein [Candidatus Omnitrophica bacterium]|nr:DUF2157 domain-containing protein [Candidatus Omnitrophota bacterium]